MSKQPTPKLDAMRKAREEQWEKRQRAERARKQSSLGGALEELEATDPVVAEAAANLEKVSSEIRQKARAAQDSDEATTKASPQARSGKKTKPSASSTGTAPKAILTGRHITAETLVEIRCEGCGKIRAVRNGKIAMHLKGLNKKCPGAGKEVL